MSNSAVIVYDCWDKHWYTHQNELDNNCLKINKLINKLRNKGYYIIHHPSDCTQHYNHNNNLQNVKNIKIKLKKLPHIDYLNSLCEPLEKQAKNKHDGNGSWWKVWKKQNENIEINQKDYLTENLSELIHILKLHKIEKLYYVGYHINLCLLWTRETSIGNLKQYMDLDTYIIKDLSEALIFDNKHLSKVYSICEKDYSTKLINSGEL